ncbi:hypothetical protein [uncultured Jatrophihabitans sp.]|uniref:hypothetical protein n=1 Tax=uncultured Jatrophihabitans sp. TaxID=1610747 RepID=UPI0035CC918F
MSQPLGTRNLVSRNLVSRRLDGWLVGWLAVIVWFAVVLADHAGLRLGSGLAAAVYWVGAVVSASHFGLSYHLAYSDGLPALRRRPVALVLGPALLVVVLASIVGISLAVGPTSAARVTSALITSVYLMTAWHYVKQVYGIGRVGAAFRGVRLTPTHVRVLRYGLYPLCFIGAAQVLVIGRNYRLAGYQVGFGVLPYEVLPWLRGLAALAAIGVGVTFVALRRSSGAWPPALLVAPYAAAFLWLGLAPSPVWTILLLAPFHALQYLAVGHRAELAVAAGRPGTHGAAWWLNVFGGAACGGLLVSRWLPQSLDAHVDRAGPLLFAAAFFVFLNLHHYLIDAVIWRSSGELVRAIVRRPGSAAPAAPATPSGQPVAGLLTS